MDFPATRTEPNILPKLIEFYTGMSVVPVKNSMSGHNSQLHQPYWTVHCKRFIIYCIQDFGLV